MEVDEEKKVGELKKAAEKFRDDRNWRKFHTPKNLAISISLEAAEMLELFQWTDPSTNEVLEDEELMKAVEEELADVFLYCINMANILDIDISSAIGKKLEANKEKYPEEEYYGKA
jgi:NTP pyrophosphatase (non-canonical NTP hydrolase)